MLEINKIYNEDCLEGMKKIDDQSIDFIICDLPYGTTACSWDEIIPFNQLWEQYNRIIKSDGVIALFGAEPFSTMVRMSNLKNYKYDWYWEKNTSTGFVFAKYQPMRSIETVSIFYRENAKYFPQGVEKLKQPKFVDRKGTPTGDIYDSETLNKKYFQEYTGYPNNILKFSRDVKGFHPTQKPVALLEYLIKTYSKKGELVLDNCMGSGTTAVAAINTDRDFIGFELNQSYFKQAQLRIEENTTQLNLFEEDV